MGAEDINAKLIEAARYGSDGGLKFFLKRGAPVGCVDENGWTPLHWAAFKPSMDCLAILLAAEADPNVRNLDGESPLHVAAKLGHIEAQRALIKAGADMKLPNKAGLTPVELAKARQS